MCHCERPFHELLIAGTCVFIAGTCVFIAGTCVFIAGSWLFIAGSWLFIDTKQLLQDAPIIPDQFWGPKQFRPKSLQKVVKKSPKTP